MFHRVSPLRPFTTETRKNTTDEYKALKNPEMHTNSTGSSSSLISMPFTETPSNMSESISSTEDTHTDLTNKEEKINSMMNKDCDLKNHYEPESLRKVNVDKDNIFVVNATESGVQIMTGDGKSRREEKEKWEADEKERAHTGEDNT